MLIPSGSGSGVQGDASLSRRVNANSQLYPGETVCYGKLIKKGEC